MGVQAVPERMSTTYPAEPPSVRKARHDVDAFARRNGVSQTSRELVALAVSEAASNVVLHAYLAEPDAASFDVEARLQPDRLVVTIEDRGGGMRARADSPGMGLGLGLIGSVAETVEIDERTPGTRLRMTFATGA